MAKKLYVLDGPVPLEPKNNTAAARKVLEKHNDDSTEVACIMLATMLSELAKGLEDLGKKKFTVVANHVTNTNKNVANAPPPPHEERQCYKCNKMGHWMRNCPEHLAELAKKRANGDGSSKGISIYVIELFIVSSNT
ncbi:uncharacterized protein LOC143617423 [Bidens hawaiensis]|uniref:uncharacterized protein LOC143617423 n=1 Tax=Bidens hawaiensis TaxID=980011 RepID=UPI0040491212